MPTKLDRDTRDYLLSLSQPFSKQKLVNGFSQIEKVISPIRYCHIYNVYDLHQTHVAYLNMP
jgi:hypothetical protein